MADDINIRIVVTGDSKQAQAAMKAAQDEMRKLGLSAKVTATSQKELAAAENAAKASMSSLGITAKSVSADFNKFGEAGSGASQKLRVLIDEMGAFNLAGRHMASQLFYLRDGIRTAGQAFGGMATAVIAGGAALSVAEQFIIRSTQAAMGFQVQQANLANAYGAAHVSLAAYNTQINDAIQSSVKLGFAQNDTIGAIERLTTVGVKQQGIFAALPTLRDIAAARGKTLTEIATSATQQGAHGGAAQLLRESGVRLSKGEEFSLNAPNTPGGPFAAFMQILQRNYGNSPFSGRALADAQTFTGQIKVARAEFERLETTIGTHLIPVFSKIFDRLIPMIDGLNRMLSSKNGWNNFVQSVAVAAGILAGAFTIALTRGLGLMRLMSDAMRSLTGPAMDQTDDRTKRNTADTQKYDSALRDIPTEVDTRVKFDAAQAMSDKDAFIANLQKLLTTTGLPLGGWGMQGGAAQLPIEVPVRLPGVAQAQSDATNAVKALESVAVAATDTETALGKIASPKIDVVPNVRTDLIPATLVPAVMPGIWFDPMIDTGRIPALLEPSKAVSVDVLPDVKITEIPQTLTPLHEPTVSVLPQIDTSKIPLLIPETTGQEPKLSVLPGIDTSSLPALLPETAGHEPAINVLPHIDTNSLPKTIQAPRGKTPSLPVLVEPSIDASSALGNEVSIAEKIQAARDKLNTRQVKRDPVMRKHYEDLIASLESQARRAGHTLGSIDIPVTPDMSKTANTIKGQEGSIASQAGPLIIPVQGDTNNTAAGIKGQKSAIESQVGSLPLSGNIDLGSVTTTGKVTASIPVTGGLNANGIRQGIANAWPGIATSIQNQVHSLGASVRPQVEFGLSMAVTDVAMDPNMRNFVLGSINSWWDTNILGQKADKPTKAADEQMKAYNQRLADWYKKKSSESRKRGEFDVNANVKVSPGELAAILGTPTKTANTLWVHLRQAQGDAPPRITTPGQPQDKSPKLSVGGQIGQTLQTFFMSALIMGIANYLVNNLFNLGIKGIKSLVNRFGGGGSPIGKALAAAIAAIGGAAAIDAIINAVSGGGHDSGNGGAGTIAATGGTTTVLKGGKIIIEPGSISASAAAQKGAQKAGQDLAGWLVGGLVAGIIGLSALIWRVVMSTFNPDNMLKLIQGGLDDAAAGIAPMIDIKDMDKRIKQNLPYHGGKGLQDKIKANSNDQKTMGWDFGTKFMANMIGGIISQTGALWNAIKRVLDDALSHMPGSPRPFGTRNGKTDARHIEGYDRYVPGSKPKPSDAPPGYEYTKEKHKSDGKMWWDLIPIPGTGAAGKGVGTFNVANNQALVATLSSIISGSGSGQMGGAVAATYATRTSMPQAARQEHGPAPIVIHTLNATLPNAHDGQSLISDLQAVVAGARRARAAV